MGFLILFLCAVGHADILAPIESIETTVNQQAGAGNLYNTTATVEAHFGDEEDSSNFTGSGHFSYGYQILPLDSSDPDGPSKHTQNYTGGFTVTPRKKAVLGADLDSSSDRFQNIFTDGVRAIVGYEPLKFSYRYARTVLRSDFITAQRRKVFLFYGAYIYQQSWDMEIAFDYATINHFTITPSYSVFNPNVNGFQALINLLPTASLGNFSDTLSNFETWNLATTWKHDWTDKYDTGVELKIGRITSTNNLLWELSIDGGHQFTKQLHAGLGWNWTDDGVNRSNLVSLELKYLWEKQ